MFLDKFTEYKVKLKKLLKLQAFYFLIFFATFLFFISSNSNAMLYGKGFITSVESYIIDTTDYIYDYLSFVISEKKFAEENKSLISKINLLLAEIDDAKKIYVENQLLKKQLKFIERQKFRTITTRLFKSYDDMSYIGMLYAGRKDKIFKNSAVIANGKLIGSVDELNDKYSSVKFVDSPSFKIAVISQNTRWHIILGGDGNKKMKIIHLDGLGKLEKGEFLITSGASNNYPYGIIVAIISDIKNNIAEITPFLDLNSLEFVNVVVE